MHHMETPKHRCWDKMSGKEVVSLAFSKAIEWGVQKKGLRGSFCVSHLQLQKVEKKTESFKA